MTATSVTYRVEASKCRGGGLGSTPRSSTTQIKHYAAPELRAGLRITWVASFTLVSVHSGI